MRNRLPLGISALLMIVLAGGVRTAPAWESRNLMTLTVVGGVADITAQGPGKLAALSARQQLRDEVCIAIADGRISRIERYLILADARRILKPKEYSGFRQSLDRLSPPKPVIFKHRAKVAQKKPSHAASPSVAKKKPSHAASPSVAKKKPSHAVSRSVAKKKPSPVAQPPAVLTIPTDVILPDRVVLTSAIR